MKTEKKFNESDIFYSFIDEEIERSTKNNDLSTLKKILIILKERKSKNPFL